MTVDTDRINDLLKQPSESLNVEIKTWIDPRTLQGKTNLIKAAFALRNRNGGYLIIGINDQTLQSDPCPFLNPNVS